MSYRTPSTCLLFAALLLAAGCQPGAVKPADEPRGNAIELQQQAWQAYQNGDWAEAEQSYRALTRQVPQEADPWFRLGNIYARQEKPAAAVAAYQEALVRQPKNGKAWHNMGVVQLRQAMNSFSNLEQATEPGDPLHARARAMLEAVTRALESDFDPGARDPVR